VGRRSSPGEEKEAARSRRSASPPGGPTRIRPTGRPRARAGPGTDNLYTVQSIPRLDFPAIAGVTLVLGALYVVVNTVVDVAQTVADPRLRV
jgi:hypothetical protein